MLGNIDAQNSIFSSDFLFEKLIPEDSIYKALRKYGSEFIKDEDFSGIYCLDNGRRSIPPTLLCGTILLMYHDKVSDEEAVQRIIFDIRWKYALNLPSDYPGFARTNLVNFRVRLLESNCERLVFDKLNALAIKIGILNPEDTQLIDSSNIIGRAAVQDTYELIRTAIKKLVKKIRKRGKKQFTDIIHKHGFEKYLAEDGKADIDWECPEQRKALLKNLVSDGRLLLNELSMEDASSDEVINKGAELLSHILEQDITPSAHGIEEDIDPEIKQGVAKDRIISTNDTEMRHGRKSSSNKFDGYKVHITENRDNEWITNLEVTPGNVHDAEPCANLVKEQEKTLGGKPRRLLGDGAYGTADNRAELSQEEVEIISPVSTYYDGKIHKEDFNIDLENNCIKCPAGYTTDKFAKSKDKKGREIKIFSFNKGICEKCQFRDKCTKSKTGRKIALNYNEKYILEAREKQKLDWFYEEYDTRPIVERKISQLMYNLGLRQGRYIGNAKIKLQAIFTVAVANLKRFNIIYAIRRKGEVCLNT